MNLPDKIWLSIIEKSNPLTWTRLKKVSVRIRDLVLGHQKTVEKLEIFADFLLEIDQVDRIFQMEYVDLEQLTAFLHQQFPALKSLSLSGCPTYVSWADLVHMAQYLPQLESLNLAVYQGMPKVARNAFGALNHFRNLASVCVDGNYGQLFDNPKLKNIILPVSTKISCNLKELEIDNSGFLFRVLRAMRSRQYELNRMNTIRFKLESTAKWKDENVLDLLFFLQEHKEKFVQIEISELKVISNERRWALLATLVAMPNVQKIKLTNCWCQDDGDERRRPRLFVQARDLRRLELYNSNICDQNFAGILWNCLVTGTV